MKYIVENGEIKLNPEHVVARVFANVPQEPQRQDGVTSQLRDLMDLANRFGMYDAADFLKTAVSRYSWSRHP